MWFSLWLCYLSIHYLSTPNWPIISCSEKTELNPLNIFSLQSCRRLSFVRRGYWGDTEGKRMFLFVGLVCSPSPASGSQHTFPKNSPAPSVSQTLQGRPLTTKGFPWYLLGPLCSPHTPLVLPWVLYLRCPQSVAAPY